MADKALVHYGTIAMSKSIPQDVYTRDMLSSKLGGVLCFEMEAAERMDHFPCLVIRGICDYGDSNRSEEWRLYAATRASAYAKELILAMSGAQSFPMDSLVGHFMENRG